MPTVNRRNVELVRTGTWAASTGVTTVKTTDLEDMVAAHADQVVDRAVIKLGHDPDNVLNAEGFGDGEPAFGWVENLGVGGTGDTGRPDPNVLYGDYVGMPAKLAEVAPAAWRRRSVEIAWDVTGTRRYSAVLTAVSLLGVTKPAVKNLADVLALYSGDQGPADGSTAIAQGPDVPALDYDALVRFAAAETGDDTTVVPPTPAGSAEGGTRETDQEGTPMKLTKADIDEALAQAGDEDVTDRLRLLLGDDQNPADEAPEAVAPDPSGQVTVQTPSGVTVTAASEADDDTVTITRSMFSELQAGAVAGISAQAQIDKDRRDALVSSAFSEGRITGAERDTWRTKLDENEALTSSLLSTLAPRFATSEFGSAAPTADGVTDTDQGAWDDFNADLAKLA